MELVVLVWIGISFVFCVIVYSYVLCLSVFLAFSLTNVVVWSVIALFGGSLGLVFV